MKTKLEFSPPETADNKFFTYPAHKVLGVFDNPQNIRETLDDLKGRGFHENEIEVICNAGQIDFSGEEQDFWGRIIRSRQHFSAEGNYLDRYERELKEGRLLLAVIAKDAETIQQVKEILQTHGGHRLAYFGNWIFEGLPEARKIQSDSHSYAHRRELQIPFDESLKRTREALQNEGFGVLCEIDIKEKFEEKLGVSFRNYVILGACSPPLAYSAVQEEPDLGLLLPCNVVVYEWNSGSVVAAIDASKMLSVAQNPKLETTAETVNEKLRRVIDRI